MSVLLNEKVLCERSFTCTPNIEDGYSDISWRKKWNQTLIGSDKLTIFYRDITHFVFQRDTNVQCEVNQIRIQEYGFRILRTSQDFQISQ